MPIVKAELLENIADNLLQGAGAPADESATVARHVIGANLAGHDSHGIIQSPNDHLLQ